MSEIRERASAETPAHGPARRLKGTCDMCAASKVRCDKQKGGCSRCEKLGLSCSYSPAQRVGRPQGKTARLARPDAASRAAASHSHSASALERRSIQPRITPLSNPELISAVNKTQSDLGDSMSGLSKMEVQVQDPFGDDMELGTVTSLLSTPSMSYGFSSIDGTFHGTESSEPDCTHTLTALQSNIELVRCNLESTARHPGHSTECSTANSAISAVAPSFKSLSTVLICPCSGQLHVGLLVAAACLSILDVYSSVIDELAPDQLSKQVACKLTPISHVSSSSRGKISSSGSIERPGENGVMIQVMAELAKLATIVHQFSKRYEAAVVEMDPAAVLRTMAQHIKSRLQTMHREITGNLLGDG